MQCTTNRTKIITTYGNEWNQSNNDTTTNITHGKNALSQTKYEKENTKRDVMSDRYQML